MKIVGIIPARYGATRLPGKALADIAGQPMIEHVYRRARQAESLDELLVATDDERIARVVHDFGGQAVMTSSEHKSGSDRIAEVAEDLECDVVVNIQGDWLLIEPATIDALTEPFATIPDLRMSTLATRLEDYGNHLKPSMVKVVVDKEGFSLYFSRAPIPYFRLDTSAEWPDNRPRQHPQSGLWPLWHLGLYAYTRATLLWLSSLPQTPLEITEGLEQLRALENGCPIKVIEVEYQGVSVDTPEDLELVRRMMEEE